MEIFSELQRLHRHLNAWQGCWALCGGVAASLYRETPRYTADIDIALTDKNGVSAEDIAQQVLGEMGFTPRIGFVPDPQGSQHTRKALICCREESGGRFAGIDFLLPIFPWLPLAVERAQQNQVDYGFAKLPTVTVEDLLLAKFSALAAGRPQDRDDIISMIKHQRSIDWIYLDRRANELAITVPDWAERRQ